MKKEEVSFSNRQVKTGEDVFAPNDTLSWLVGGQNQTVGETIVTVISPEQAYYDEYFIEEDDLIANEDIDDSLSEASIGVVTNVTFEQSGRFTGNGTFLADVTAIIENVKGAVDYDVEFIKIS